MKHVKLSHETKIALAKYRSKARAVAHRRQNLVDRDFEDVKCACGHWSMEHTEERKNKSGSECWCGCKRFRDPDAYRLKQASKKRGSEKMRELKDALAKAQRRAADAEARAAERERDARRAVDQAINAQLRVGELKRLVAEGTREKRTPMQTKIYSKPGERKLDL